MNKDIKFNTPFEMSQYIVTHDTTRGCKNFFGSRDVSSHRTDRGDWYGTKDFAEADQLFKDGDTENAQRM